MKRYIKNLVAALLVTVIMLSTYLPVIAVGQPSTYSKTSNSGERDVIATTLDGTSALNYYKGNNTYENLSNKSSGEILSALRSLMTSTHSYYSSYDDCKNLASKTDCENENGKVILIYTGVSSTQSAANSGWNREHVWPKSLGGYETSGAGSDLHHIRPSDNRVNSCRGNLKYGNVSGGKVATGGNAASGISGGTYGGGYFEPLDNVKGDVARICLYMYVRYGGEAQYTCQNITTVFQSVDVLLEWCEIDPVDTWELGRNEVVEAKQGNRNVFIDYPEYAWLIFGKQVPSNMTTPSGEAAKGNNNQGGNTDPDDGNDTPVIPECTHKNTVIKGAVAADCYNEGYTGDVYCAECDELVSRGSKIPVTNGHKFGDWELLDDGTYEKHCTVCGARVSLTLDSLIGDIDSDAEKILVLLTLGVTDSALLDALARQ